MERDGTRTLSALKVWEVSLVAFPMNAESTVDSVKHADPAMEAALNRLLRAMQAQTEEWKAIRRARMSPGEAAIDRLQEVLKKVS